jgi:TnpA family transposase
VASIERTAYPRFKRIPTVKELSEVYTPTPQEIQFAYAAARGAEPILSLLVMLKAFQRLGYFPTPGEIPGPVIAHIKACLGVGRDVTPQFPERSRYRHQKAIREYLEVLPYGKYARHVATEAIFKASHVMDNPADLINVAIEELINHRCELPAFAALDRLAGRIRTLVNHRFFATVLTRLSQEDRNQLDRLLDVTDASRRSEFSFLKVPPKSATLTHMRDLQFRFSWLLSMGDVEGKLAGIPNAKIKHFAAEARALDAAEIRDFAPPKRYTMLLAMLHRARVTARDNLVETFLKRIGAIHNDGKQALVELQEKHRAKTENLISVFAEVLQTTDSVQDGDDAELGRQLRTLLAARGGSGSLLEDCAAVSAFHGNNYLPLLWNYFKSNRSALFRVARLLTLKSTTQDQTLMAALDFVLANERRRATLIPENLDLSFASDQWVRTVMVRDRGSWVMQRQHLEVCVFSHLAAELKSGDISVQGSENFADYRNQLLAWSECEPMVAGYCRDLGFESTPQDFVRQLRNWLTETAGEVDRNYPDIGQVVISENGEPVLKRIVRKDLTVSAVALERNLLERIPERNIIDVLCNVHYYTNWTRHFGPLSGSNPKLENPVERYIITTFGYGCNLGPVQTARHMRGVVTHHQLSFVNRRHVSAAKLDAAIRDIINQYNRFGLPKVWGDGTAAAADGTKFDLYEENLVSEYHIRYGGYGGIAYHHVADSYIALFSHFIPCGVWEAVYIIDGLLKNKSDVQPDTLHADTQGQSLPVFALAHLLGIKLMPRIRNWKDLKFFRPSKDAIYKHIDPLFSDPVDWDLLETHWRDLLQVVLSIKVGKVLPSTLLRKLGNYSRKNRLYQAFVELGRVVRTVFLLKYMSDIQLREQITASTNKVEAYNGFSKWVFFGGEGVITENDPEEQEKRIKYKDLVSNIIIFLNVVDMTFALRQLIQEGHTVTREDLATLSPYLTRHIKRFGDYVIDLEQVPQPLEAELPVPL